ncbi:MAG TPA: hypothetical protein VFO54_06010 [Chryseosolibacter sp.]|nr:hypothetical protein [Chryseosolibacter sp.]
MKTKLLFTCLVALLFAFSANAQGFVNKLKQKADQAASKALEKKAKEKAGISDETDEQNNTNQDQNASQNKSKPSNKGGGGLISTPPDVKQNLTDAETAYKAGSYGEARYAVQQAMLGVEMEIGRKVLEGLPSSVSGLDKVQESDQVTSSGYGWAGLTIHREYLKDDKQLTTTVANNSAWMSAVNMYMASGGYAQTTNGEQNWKQVKVKGHKAIIEYDESSGYKLSVPLGQTSLIVWEGVNFASEQEMMAAANAFDIDGIKKMLGEK